MTFRNYLKNTRGATALEFALLFPVFVFILFGIVEIGAVLLFNLILTDGAKAGVDYLLDARMNHEVPTEGGLRDAVQSALLFDLGSDRLAIELVPIPDARIAEAKIAYPVEDSIRFDEGVGQYVLMVGYDWNVSLPTTRYLVPSVGGRTQLTTTQLAIVAVRASE